MAASFDPAAKWYHGSPEELLTLRAGSSITQREPVARAFSHRPSLVSQFGDGRVKHDGLVPGYLYVVDEPISDADVYPHPHPVNADGWEWLTARDLPVRLMQPTVPRVDDLLTEADLDDLRALQERAGQETFAVSEPGPGLDEPAQAVYSSANKMHYGKKEISMESTRPLYIAAELDSLESSLRAALESLDAAAASARWIDREAGADWSDSLPGGEDIEDLAQQIREMVHRVLDYQSELVEDEG